MRVARPPAMVGGILLAALRVVAGEKISKVISLMSVYYIQGKSKSDRVALGIVQNTMVLLPGFPGSDVETVMSHPLQCPYLQPFTACQAWLGNLMKNRRSDDGTQVGEEFTATKSWF